MRDNAMLVDDNLWAAPPAPSPPPLFCLQPPSGAWTCTTFRGFQDAGFDAHGRFADPVFGSAGFVPSPTSPAIDGGVVVTPSWLADGGANFGDYVAAYDDEPASFPARDHAGVLRTPSCRARSTSACTRSVRDRDARAACAGAQARARRGVTLRRSDERTRCARAAPSPR